MAPNGIRFSPPQVACPAELQWAIQTAFGPEVPPLMARMATERIAEHAIRFDLAPRIVLKLGRKRVTNILGAAGRSLIPPVYAALARQQRALYSIPALAAIAARNGHPLAVLKAMALLLGGYSSPGWRNSGDVDVLVPEAAAPSFWNALLSEGWKRVGGEGGEENHSLPLLDHPVFGRVEVHWCLLGVDLAGNGRSASFRDARELGLLRAPEGQPTAALIPSRELCAAFAAVHGVAQHGFGIDYPYFRVPADLIDLGFGQGRSKDEIAPWVSRSLSAEELSALFSLAVRLNSGNSSLFEGFDRSSVAEILLLRHFVAAGLTPHYKESLRLAAASASLSDDPLFRILVRRLWRALSPSAKQLEQFRGPSSHLWSPLVWRILRPFELIFRLVRHAIEALFLKARGD